MIPGADLKQPGGLTAYPRSAVRAGDSTFFLAASEDGASRFLGVRGDPSGFEGAARDPGGALLCPLTAANAGALRARLPWLRPAPVGPCTSAGFGDRLGLATPGHARAMRKLPGGEEAIAPIFAQQSVRENARTGRTPQEVVDDATWGLFQEGWRGPWGADADHLKTPAAADEFVEAGYTLFTIDPGDHVDDQVLAVPAAEAQARGRDLPWETLEDTPRDLERRYLDRPWDLEGCAATFDRETLWRTAAKYGRAVAHTARMCRHIAGRMAGKPFEIEISVDETESPTTAAEHLFIATELHRLGVCWVSLAPRFVGRFEKGVDYIGDLGVFASELARHAAVARALGPYKLSLHSGSDKFSIYPLAARLSKASATAPGAAQVHLKTAGTSYLEALRATALVDAELFREILAVARERYDADRATYHVSAQLARLPAPDELGDDELAAVLDLFDARQILHVTFGSVLDRFGDRLRATLRRHEETHYSLLETHFLRHLSPFVA